MKPIAGALMAAVMCTACVAVSAAQTVRDAGYFLRRLRTVEHLPELERSHTAMASTWDRKGGNADGTEYKRIEGTTNVLFDGEGPGCIHRLFTGGAATSQTNTPGYLKVDGTRLQIYLDEDTKPVFDFPVVEFFDPEKGPIPAPLAGNQSNGWTYPGCLMPIPYARHCRVQLVNPGSKNWGCYWQITYTSYPKGSGLRTLSWPFTKEIRMELERTCETWREVQAGPPTAPQRLTASSGGSLEPGKSSNLTLKGVGLVRELRVAAEPASEEVLRGLRLTLTWDGDREPSVDVPVGAFFGHMHSGHAKPAQFSTLLLGVTGDEAYSRFPMPYARGAVIRLRNDGREPVSRFHLKVDAEKRRALPRVWGRFRADFREARAAVPGGPVFGAKDVPGHVVIDRRGAGKYVGTMLSVDWPHEGWWGEGDWLIWSDETIWPPSYHGTGSEEYFNSGWCKFDRKAISGYVAVHPGHPTQYSFHLNDSFQFRQNIKVAVETVGWDKADVQIGEEHPVWETVAYWYAAPRK